MRPKVHTVNVEFRLSHELYADIGRISAEHQLSLKEFTIASVGLLNAAHRSHFSTQKTKLYVPSGENPKLPPIRTPNSETKWPAKVAVSLAPHLYDPMSEYADEDLGQIRERGRQAFRFGAFILSRISPLEDEPVMFWHFNDKINDEELIGIPFRTKQ